MADRTACAADNFASSKSIPEAPCTLPSKAGVYLLISLG